MIENIIWVCAETLRFWFSKYCRCVTILNVSIIYVFALCDFFHTTECRWINGLNSSIMISSETYLRRLKNMTLIMQEASQQSLNLLLLQWEARACLRLAQGSQSIFYQTNITINGLQRIHFQSVQGKDYRKRRQTDWKRKTIVWIIKSRNLKKKLATKRIKSYS